MHIHADTPLAIRLNWHHRPLHREALWLDEFLMTICADRDTVRRVKGTQVDSSRLTCREQLIAAWQSLAEKYDNNACRQQEESLSVLRQLVRSALESYAPDAATIWVRTKNNNEIERTASYVVVASMRLRDIDARPWLWEALPAIGRCLHCSVSSRDNEAWKPINVLPVLATRQHECLAERTGF